MWVLWFCTKNVTKGRIPLFYERDDSFHSYVKDLMGPDEDRTSLSAEIDKVAYMFSHLILAHRKLTKDYSDIQSIDCQNGFKLIVKLPADGLLLFAGVSADSVGSSLLEAERRMDTLITIITFLYGPSYSYQLGLSSLTNKKTNWDVISLLLNKWHEMLDTEQCYLVEAVEEISIIIRSGDSSKEKFDSILNDARRLIKHHLGCSYDYAIHTMLVVESKIVKSSSSEKDRVMSPYDMLLVLLVSLSYFPSHLVPEELFSKTYKREQSATTLQEESEEEVLEEHRSDSDGRCTDRYFVDAIEEEQDEEDEDEDLILATDPSDSQSLMSAQSNASATTTGSSNGDDLLDSTAVIANQSKDVSMKANVNFTVGDELHIQSEMKEDEAENAASDNCSIARDLQNLQLSKQEESVKDKSHRDIKNIAQDGGSIPEHSVVETAPCTSSTNDKTLTVVSPANGDVVPQSCHLNVENLKNETKSTFENVSTRTSRLEQSTVTNLEGNIDLSTDVTVETQLEETTTTLVPEELLSAQNNSNNCTPMSSLETIKGSTCSSEAVATSVPFLSIEKEFSDNSDLHPQEETSDQSGSVTDNTEDIVPGSIPINTQNDVPISFSDSPNFSGLSQSSGHSYSRQTESPNSAVTISSLEGASLSSPRVSSFTQGTNRSSLRKPDNKIRRIESLTSTSKCQVNVENSGRRRHQSLQDRAYQSSPSPDLTIGDKDEDYYSAPTPPYSPISRQRRPSADSDASYHTAVPMQGRSADCPLNTNHLLDNVLERADIGHLAKGVFVHKRVFLRSPVCDFVPACLYVISVSRGINIIVAAEITDPQKPNKIVEVLAQLSQLLNSLETPDNRYLQQERVMERMADKLRDVSELVSSRYKDRKNKDDCEEMLKLWKKIQANLKKYYRSRVREDDEDLTDLGDELDDDILLISKILKKLFRDLYMRMSPLSEDALVRIQSLQMRANRKLRFYKQILLVKANINMAISAFQNEKYPGLVHFIYIYRNKNTMKSPSIQLASDDDSLKAQVVRDMKKRLWRILPWMYKQVANGYTSISVKDGDFVFTFDLYVYDEVYYKFLTKVLNSPALYSPKRSAIGDLRGQFYKHMSRITDLGAGCKCLEFLTVHFAVIPQDMIKRQRVQLFENELHKKSDIIRTH